ncbi:hypothetical protein BLNAU_11957 [Blattamonas nauphoetae]|uniref:Uncharacterized protein n=1 Tax=Blattamonas nauphoetae TaxID=2049346 RepID=A0ABQ9XRS3_9EUKA|nr:hypothetical protein BLNAU_11957 [Blattamonas nauphoetae]
MSFDDLLDNLDDSQLEHVLSLVEQGQTFILPYLTPLGDAKLQSYLQERLHVEPHLAQNLSNYLLQSFGSGDYVLPDSGDLVIQSSFIDEQPHQASVALSDDTQNRSQSFPLQSRNSTSTISNPPMYSSPWDSFRLLLNPHILSFLDAKMASSLSSGIEYSTPAPEQPTSRTKMSEFTIFEAIQHEFPSYLEDSSSNPHVATLLKAAAKEHTFSSSESSRKAPTPTKHALPSPPPSLRNPTSIPFFRGATLNSSFLVPNTKEFDLRTSSHSPSIVWARAPTRTLFLLPLLEPGSVYSIFLRIQFPSNASSADKASMEKWNIGATMSRLIETVSNSGSPAMTGSSAFNTVLGGDPMSVRLQLNGALIHNGKSAARQPRWEVFPSKTGAGTSVMFVGMEFDLRPNPRNGRRLRFFANGEELGTSYVDLPYARMAAAVRCGMVGTEVIILRFQQGSEPSYSKPARNKEEFRW